MSSLFGQWISGRQSQAGNETTEYDGITRITNTTSIRKQSRRRRQADSLKTSGVSQVILITEVSSYTVFHALNQYYSIQIHNLQYILYKLPICGAEVWYRTHIPLVLQAEGISLCS
jgi:hypothetical protein